MIPANHPYWHVRAVVESRPEVDAVPFSYYTYQPQTVTDTRTTFLVATRDFMDERYVDRVMADAPVGQELAVHSDLRLCDGARAHLVMVDMATAARAHLEKLRTFLGDNFFQRIAWFASGRSFHGYGEDLLAEADWVKFMGLLLLANKPRLEPTVDPRWIGHRLMAGYAALRWTRNTMQYLVTPSSIEQPNPRAAHQGAEVGPLGKPVSSRTRRS